MTKMIEIKTPQQALWNGDFGDAYHERNYSVDRYDFWREVLYYNIRDIQSIFEPGAGKGDNLIALRRWAFKNDVFPRVTGMDINKSACLEMERRGIVAIPGAFPNVIIGNEYDLVITRGFLIHLPKAELDKALAKIYNLSKRYICLVEYYSPARRRVSYHGHRNAMWTADYAGMMMKDHPDLQLLKYGFKYHKEGGDDVSWFLMEKV